MISMYKVKALKDEELFDAVSVLEKEYKRKYRNTPVKMAQLISSNFDVECSPSAVSKFFAIDEDYERESLKTEFYGNMQSLRE